jgi:putative hemolysin
MPFGFELIVMTLMLALNAVFAAYEMALASISRARILMLVNEKRRGASQAAFMKDRIEASLAVVQLGITFVGSLGAATGGTGVEEFLAPFLEQTWGMQEQAAEIVALLFLIVILSTVTVIFAELVPKTFALENKEWVVLKLSPGMKSLSHMIYPVVSFFEKCVKTLVGLGSKKLRDRGVHLEGYGSQWLHELRAAASLARTARLLGAREEKIVLAAAQLSSRPVKDIVLPAEDISTICLADSLSDALLKAHMDMHTRFPVCAFQNDPQSIIGFVNFKDIVVALNVDPENPSIKQITQPIKRVMAKTPISAVLEEMIQHRAHISLVADENDKILGMVTLEDIIEELVGEIEDEFDRLPTHLHPYGSSWIAGGGVLMHAVAGRAGVPWDLNAADAKTLTLAAWCERQKVNVLQGAKVIEADGLRVVMRKFRRNKLSEAVVSPLKRFS